ncbi:CPBP family intramembrane glutamic endopeptidase [Psychroserpens sp.]|uniref:CPBP family intramembrane glutamic endopeptidase n=1 Tax=Psychroserpens sp. TaxID=2020870 RepID=UPI001B220C3B|nr:CPBP family intramembrane glutamic endopeptidase [Psychroserpens sp.]MBO6608038.1 CPBP family intramembrane metalloprotease [Psychroserpens sp.]MBO6655148.1 CPBP family intramembrane metalloprotease [Psychroserpens sp.]MBO6683248.1 CPBP family intramembrane metalloprotease [Psychroserpens sp.]MBO6751411.1 CPBP family intramembrane metalloprotease [Psychroserpens sp.]MBO6916737.1 CPBP family intramembrane metalloprotease [Psychroserpens sp.]
MKSLLLKYPVFFRYTGAIILFTLALIVSGFIDRPILKTYFPFTSVILLLLVTALLYKWDKKSLKSIGLNVTRKNLSFFPLGILIGAIAFMIAKYFRGLYTGELFELTTAVIDYKVLLYGFYTILPAVMIEELLFRGYLFKKTVEVSNVVIANIIFGVLFMLVHILDREIIQHRAMVLFLMITIPVGHLLFATALLKSKTLYFPIGIHLGNNWATRHLITKSNNGESIFYIPENAPIDTWTDFIIVLIVFNAFFLFVTFVIWKWDKIIVRMKNYLAIF